MTNFKPCPFCGSDDGWSYVYHWDEDIESFMFLKGCARICHKCFAHTDFFETEEEADKKWIEGEVFKDVEY